MFTRVHRNSQLITYEVLHDSQSIPVHSKKTLLSINGDRGLLRVNRLYSPVPANLPDEYYTGWKWPARGP